LVRYGYHGEDRFKPGESFDKKLIETIASGDFERILDIREEYSSLFRAAAPEGNLNPLYIALGASDKNRFVGKTLLHEFMYYGVSLVAMMLSAGGVLRDSLLRQDFQGALV
jgi:aromatic ring-opening dioxygenase catalytic subunit (LigB family)